MLKKSVDAFVIVAAAVFLIGALGLLFILGREVSVEHAGKRFVLDADTVSGSKFVFTAEDGDTVTGELCTSCGGMVVTHGGESGVSGQAWKDGYSYKMQEVAEGCNHENGISGEEAYRFTLAAARKNSMNGYSGTIWMYWGIEGAVLFLAAWYTTKKAKKSGLVAVLIKIAALLFAAAIYIDVLFM